MHRDPAHGGELVAQTLLRHGVQWLFTLCGGHISPILVAAKRLGIRIVDVRDEATAVFAADAVSRLDAGVGVAAVTAGPGLTNTITAVKNAQLAQSPLLVLGGATATVLRNRGALQDIDQLALVRPHVKWARSVRRVGAIRPALERALTVARSGVPGPVFVELPLDLLYPEPLVRSWYEKSATTEGAQSAKEVALRWALRAHLGRVFSGSSWALPSLGSLPSWPRGGLQAVQARRARQQLATAERPLLLVGSQALLAPGAHAGLRRAIEQLGVPTYLSGMARGLLGSRHELWLRHGRKQALREADLVLLAGVPCDFRLEYGRQIPHRARVIAVNRSATDLRRNRWPSVGVRADPAGFLGALAASSPPPLASWRHWLARLTEREAERERDIDAKARVETDLINPVALFRELDRVLPASSTLVADGGDFVGTAAYTLRPRGHLSWLDPGVFGTLGVGAGFALAAKLARPDHEVWILYGDGSAGYSLIELDTFARHGLPVIALVGNDASWQQIARDQTEVLGDDVGTVLARTEYHRVAEGLGAHGLLLERPADVAETLVHAQQLAAGGRPVLINALLSQTDFRKGSISV